MEDTAMKMFKENATGTGAIRVDISEGLDILGLPYMAFEKGERILWFLLDTGAWMNFLRKDVLDEFSDEISLMPYKTEFFGIDNVGHETNVYSLSVNLGHHTFVEEFQELVGEDALSFPLGDQVLQLDGIMGYPFFTRYGACFSYASKTMYISVPEPAPVANKDFATSL